MFASRQYDHPTQRGGIATMEFVMSLPFLFVLMAMIYTLAMRSMDQASVSMDVRNRAWLERTGVEASPTASKPFEFGAANTGATHARQHKELRVYRWLGGERTSLDETNLIAGTWDYQQVKKEIQGADPHTQLLSKLGISGASSIASIAGLFRLQPSGSGTQQGVGIDGNLPGDTGRGGSNSSGGGKAGPANGEREKEKTNKQGPTLDDLIQAKIDQLLEQNQGNVWRAFDASEKYRLPSRRNPDRDSELWVGVNHYLGYRWATQLGVPSAIGYLVNELWQYKPTSIAGGSGASDTKHNWAKKGIEDGMKANPFRDLPHGFTRHPLFPGIIVGPDGKSMTEEEFLRRYAA